jgi:hypothetical protein
MDPLSGSLEYWSFLMPSSFNEGAYPLFWTSFSIFVVHLVAGQRGANRLYKVMMTSTNRPISFHVRKDDVDNANAQDLKSFI